MSLDACSGFLDALALLNVGTDHVPDYSIVRLPSATSCRSSLELHFASLSTSLSAKQPASAWHIELANVPDDWIQVVATAARRWFFEQRFSPRVEPEVANELVSRFIELLQAAVGSAGAWSVNVAPPMWYECTWQDFAFESPSGTWLLHFGFSD